MRAIQIILSAFFLAGVTKAFDWSLKSCNEFAANFESTSGVWGCNPGTGNEEGTPYDDGWFDDQTLGTSFTCSMGTTGSKSWCVGMSAKESRQAKCTHNY